MSRVNKVAAVIVAILALISLGLGLLVDGVTALRVTNNSSVRQTQAQCASLGGVYDGKQCWYAGKITSVDDLMERLYGEHGSAD